MSLFIVIISNISSSVGTLRPKNPFALGLESQKEEHTWCWLAGGSSWVCQGMQWVNGGSSVCIWTLTLVVWVDTGCLLIWGLGLRLGPTNTQPLK